MKFYAVAVGRVPGVYRDWPSCQAQVQGFTGGRFKGFSTEWEAENFVHNPDRPLQVPPPFRMSIGSPSGVAPPSSESDERPSLEAGPRKSSPRAPSIDELSSGVWASQSYPDLGLATKSMSLDSPASTSRGPNRIIVYTDGACPDNGNGAICAGIGVHFPSRPELDLSEPLEGPPFTNNRAEIWAVIRALQQAETLINEWALDPNSSSEEPQIVIRTDSQHVIDTMTRWLPKRLRTNWDCKNSDLFRMLYELQELYDVHYEYVRGHNGDPGNTRADLLAVAGARK